MTYLRFVVITVAALTAGFVVVLAAVGDNGPGRAGTTSVAVDGRTAPFTVDGSTVRSAPPERIEADVVCDEPPEPLPSPATDLASWLDALPEPDEVGNIGESQPDQTYGMRSAEPVMGMTIRGGSSAALLTEEGVTVGCSLLAGATDGLKPADGTILRDSFVQVSYGPGAHSDHVQVTDRNGVEIRRVRFLAENERGTTDVGWNAAFFVHGDATDWVLEDVHVQAGSADRAVRSYFPLRLTTGSGIVRRVVIDRGAMRSEQAVQVGDSASILVWEDVYIRESDGSLTPVPRP